jgi:hypothetical protein
MNKPLVIWEKWKDPLGFEEQEDTFSKNNKDYYNEEEDTIFEDEITKTKKIKCHIINTPFGMIPVNENTTSTNIFNFWSGHTNFPITNVVSDIIENTDGVETLNVFTKYRFRIAVGKAFNDSIVLRNINNNIYNYLE